LDKVGRVISGRYELLERAGEGGMAVVWRGVARGAAGFARPIAFKRILQPLANDQQFIAMFIEEARVGSQLQHPNIVQIEDFGRDETGGYFLVSEWVDGLDLRRYLYAHSAQQCRPPWQLLVAITIEILRGLAWAHERQDAQGRPTPIFHRDLTPGNILIGVNGVAKLTDFGLARSMDRGAMTDPNIIKGKLAYLAPEATFGEKPSVQTDLYSLGVVLWEALAMRKLFDGTTDAEVFLGVRKAEVPPLAGECPGLPPTLCQAVQRALAYEPAHRYPSAQHMSRALANILRAVPVPTDSALVGKSVVEARRMLARATVPPPPPERRSPPREVLIAPREEDEAKLKG
jgi:serine/threonine-protein kinase